MSVPTRLTIVAAVNNEQVLEANLKRSPVIARGEVPLHCYRGCASAGEAYNRGLAETDAEIVVFAHQDVYLPESWLAAFRKLETALAVRDPDWAVLGVFGVSDAGALVGQVWSSGLDQMLGAPLEQPVPVQSVDELLIVLRRASGVRFDPDLPGYHLYGTDIIQSALEQGKGAHVGHMPVIHNSRPTRIRSDYARAWRYMRGKWRHLLPLPTLVVPVTTSPWSLLRIRLRHFRHRRRIERRARIPPRDPVSIARQFDLE